MSERRRTVRTARVNLRGGRAYPIRIGSGLLDEVGGLIAGANLGTDLFVVSSPRIARLYKSRLVSGLKKAGLSHVKFALVPDGEPHKTIDSWHRLVDGIVRFDAGMQRRVVVVALGGGVVGDVGGFVAATFRRGIPLVQVPTTLLAMVDSSVGGKTGVNHPRGKNLIGAFHQPSLVAVDPELLVTLPKRELYAGLAEVIKYGIIRDYRLFRTLERWTEEILALAPRRLAHLIERSCAIKARVVEADERETLGLRTILNFGHTVGHAVEAATGFGWYRHGEAVAVGMLCAADIACTLKMFDRESAARFERLVDRFGLPLSAGGCTLEAVWAALQHDKKFIRGRNRFVLPVGIGEVRVVEGLEARVVKGAIRKRLSGR